MIISFASTKGGVGKSTACASIAAEIATAGSRVLILDLDHNQTLARWAKKATIPGLDIEAVDRDLFTARFREVMHAGNYDHVLIDLAGTREATVLKAIARSDLIIIPAQASEPDLREALVVITDIKDVEEEARKPIAFRLLLTKMFPLRTRVTDFAHAEIHRHSIPRFRTTLVERAAYREMFLTGKAPSRNSKAGEEVAQLAGEVLALSHSTNKAKRSA